MELKFMLSKKVRAYILDVLPISPLLASAIVKRFFGIYSIVFINEFHPFKPLDS